MFRNSILIFLSLLAPSHVFLQAQAQLEDSAKGIANIEGALRDLPSTNDTVLTLAHIPGEDLYGWEPPAEMSKSFPYYLMGYDHDKRPVLVCEFGSWDIRGYLDKGEESRALMYKYTRKFFHYMDSLKAVEEDAEDGISYLIDAAGFSLSQLASSETIKFQLLMAREAEKRENYFANAYIINVGFATQTWINLIRPVAGRWIGKVDVVSNQPQKIKAALVKIMPDDQIPPWMGGNNKNYKPAQILGK